VGPAWTEPAVVWVKEDNLVFIGSGVEETRIGPAEYFNPPGVLPKVICAIDDYRASFTNLTIENCCEGLYWSYGRFEVSDCAILNCESGVIAWAEDGASFDNVVFSSESGTSYAINTFYPMGETTVSRCQFSGNGLGSYFSGTSSGHVYDSQFTVALASIVFYGSLGLVEGCHVSQDVGQGVIVANNSEVQLRDSEFNGWINAMEVQSGSIVDAEGCIFLGGIAHPTIYIYATSQVNVNGCHIINGGNYSVKCEYFFYQHIVQDMTGNYWGTTDPDTVAEWIWDGNDDSSIHSIVEYIPMADGPVPTEDKSWTELKQMYR